MYKRQVDALYIASQIVVAVQGLVTRRTSPTEPVIIGIGKLNAGTKMCIRDRFNASCKTMSENYQLSLTL